MSEVIIIEKLFADQSRTIFAARPRRSRRRAVSRARITHQSIGLNLDRIGAPGLVSHYDYHLPRIATPIGRLSRCIDARGRKGSAPPRRSLFGPFATSNKVCQSSDGMRGPVSRLLCVRQGFAATGRRNGAPNLLKAFIAAIAIVRSTRSFGSKALAAAI